jgi:hypothetical protein
MSPLRAFRRAGKRIRNYNKKASGKPVAENKIRMEKRTARFEHIPMALESLEPRLLLTADPLSTDDYVQTSLNVDIDDFHVMDAVALSTSPEVAAFENLLNDSEFDTLSPLNASGKMF